MIAIRTRTHVVLYAAVITLLAVTATSGFVYVATAHLPRGPGVHFAMLLASGLPLVIAPPIALLALSILRMMTLGLDKIEAFVKFDALTGLLARSYFMESVRQRFGEGGAFMLVDADHFKRINDGFGHDVGDEALRVIGRVLNATAPPEALVGRIGGEEFGVFLPGTDRTRVGRVADALCAAMRRDGRIIAGKPLDLTLSIGIAVIERGSTLTLIYKEADESLYSAKAAGRDRYVLSREPAGEPVAFRRSA